MEKVTIASVDTVAMYLPKKLTLIGDLVIHKELT